MFKFLFRCVLFIVGLAFIADAGLPVRVEQLRIDRHTSYSKNDFSGPGGGDTSYTLHLIDGVVSTCSVGYAIYTQLHDGDRIEVRSTRLSRTCIRITRGDEVIEDDKHWKLWVLAFGLMLVAAGLGWLRDDDDDEDRGRFRMRLG